MNPSEKSAQWISNAMKAAGISQAELARRLGVKHSYISKLLNGRVAQKGMRVDTLFRMIEACGFEIGKLNVTRKKAA